MFQQALHTQPLLGTPCSACTPPSPAQHAVTALAIQKHGTHHSVCVQNVDQLGTAASDLLVVALAAILNKILQRDAMRNPQYSS